MVDLEDKQTGELWGKQAPKPCQQIITENDRAK
jgi:hypothetical protein